jgi:hypothetical protein
MGAAPLGHAGEDLRTQGVPGLVQGLGGHVLLLLADTTPSTATDPTRLVTRPQLRKNVRHTPVASLLCQAKLLISGPALEYEVRLDREQPRPRCDVLLVLRRGQRHNGTIPWAIGPAVPGELIRAYAVEIDRATEAASIIREKAIRYNAVATDPGFYRRYGRMPIPLWVVPSSSRRDQVQMLWEAVWPDGRWLIATDADMPALRFQEYRG